MPDESYTPQLVLTQSARAKLDTFNTEEYLSAISILFEILSDPHADDVRKFATNSFPYASGIIEFLADGWYVAYRIAGNGDVQVSRMFRESDLPPRYPA